MKNTTKKISEITIESNVRRIKRDSSGQRYNEYLTFNIGYNPTIKNFSIRLFAKFIDIVLFSIVAIVLYIVLHRRFEDFYEWFAVSLLLLILINPILENKFGKSLGKKFLKIQVIDDFGNCPNLVLSYKRNFLSLISLLQFSRQIPGELPIKNNKHNQMCTTYTVFDKDKAEIIAKLGE